MYGPGFRACRMIRCRLLTKRTVCSAPRSCALVRQKTRTPASMSASRSAGRRRMASSLVSTIQLHAPASRSQVSSASCCAWSSPDGGHGVDGEAAGAQAVGDAPPEAAVDEELRRSFAPSSYRPATIRRGRLPPRGPTPPSAWRHESRLRPPRRGRRSRQRSPRRCPRPGSDRRDPRPGRPRERRGEVRRPLSDRR